jgi:hypothetical protein
VYFRTVDDTLFEDVENILLVQARGQNYMAVLALRLALLKDHNPHIWQDVGK